jgi:FixJ family two-component response regulator
MATRRVTIAIVEDDAGVRTALRQLLRAAEFDALTFASAEEFLESNHGDTRVDGLIVDINLPRMNGVALLKVLAADGGMPPAVLITARDDPATFELIRQAGPVPWLRKPFTSDELFDAISRARRV